MEEPDLRSLEKGPAPLAIRAVKPGDRLWYVPNFNGGRPYEITVKSVGRKWAETEGHHTPKVDLETGEAHGGVYSSPGRAWPSKEAHEHALALNAAWRDLISRVPQHQAPSGMTLEKIEDLRRLLLESRAPQGR